MRIAVTMLANGAQAEDVEASIGQLARAYDVGGVQAAVSFSMISISRYTRHDEPPTTLLHLVRDRRTDFTRLAAVSEIVRHIRGGGLDLETAESQMDLDSPGSSWSAPPVRGTGTVGRWDDADVRRLEALATLAIGLLVQPALAAGPREPPPFFRLGIGAAGSAILVALLVALGLERWARADGQPPPLPARLRPRVRLPRLIDGSVVSGTARLAEAILLAAVAGGPR